MRGGPCWFPPPRAGRWAWADAKEAIAMNKTAAETMKFLMIYFLEV
ncbi:hypothetical protein RRSWK_03542 [Rhodopirellula sp. SWK7]|nr:hypothetical protein RRSWK_03542 [Rhodopirellula sp. SWK7]